MSVKKEILYLSRGDVEEVNLPMDEIIGLIEMLCKEKDEGFIEVPPKKWLHPKKKDSFFSSMPCQFTRLGLAGCKWQSGFPTNAEQDLPYIIGLIILNDIETGAPYAIMDSSWIVGKRTAAASAVAAKHLARQDCRTLAIIGCGVQGRAHVESLLRVRSGINEVRAYDIDPRQLTKFVNHVERSYNISCVAASSPQFAALNADIIVTAGIISKTSEGILNGDVLKKGVYLCPVDYDSYWKKDAFSYVDKFYTDDLGTLLDHREDGYFSSMPSSMPELASVVAGNVPGRESDAEKILFMNIGIGPSDIIVANRVFEIAVEKKAGRVLPV